MNDKIENILNGKLKTKFDIFFLDPPFADEEFTYTLNLIKKNILYKSQHVAIIHRDNKVEDNLDKYIKTISIKRYGRSKIIFGVFN